MQSIRRIDEVSLTLFDVNNQTEGRKEGTQVKMLSPPEIQGQRKRSLQAPLKTPPNLNISLPASLPIQRSQKPERPPTPDPDWSKRRQVDFRPPQTWISQVAHAEEPPTSFDELNDTSFDFSAFALARVLRNYSTILKNVPKQQLNDLTGITLKTNHMEYLKGGDLSRHYSTSVIKSKAATYELKWIEDLVPELWSPIRRIIAVTRLTIMKKYDYGHLEEIEVRRDDQNLYTFKEGDFKRLRLQDIEDMLLLLVKQKLTNLTIDERYDLNVAL
ncbi:hypothetical protein Tco_0889865, partial [Tanacetum coccineum]